VTDIGERDIACEERVAPVWQRPTVEVARALGVSDLAVAKLCARLQVPKAPRGYRARVHSGATPRRPPLAAFREEREENRKHSERRPLVADGFFPAECARDFCACGYDPDRQAPGAYLWRNRM
jgi:hypothetical protein